MINKYSINILSVLLVSLVGFTAHSAVADGGVAIQGTRVIYPMDSKQQSLSVSNSSLEDGYLVQSWVEDSTGHKSHDFIVTPPLYLSEPKNENTLRLMRVGAQLPHDRESLYYFVSKAIPSFDDKDGAAKNVLRIAAATRIKLFVRPAGLTPSVEKSPALLSAHRVDGKVEIFNPTPYYITLTNIKAGSKSLKDIMVSPKSSVQESLTTDSGNRLTFHTINDYGSITKETSIVIK